MGYQVKKINIQKKTQGRKKIKKNNKIIKNQRG